MNYRKVIHDAWVFTQENKPLVWWYSFFPSMLTLLVGIFYVAYQFFAFKRSPLFEAAEHSFLYEVVTFSVNFFGDHTKLIVPAIIAAVVVAIFYFLFPTLCQGGLIQIIARRRTGVPVKNIEGFGLGAIVFLPLFEYHLVVRTFTLVSLFTEAAFVLRNLGPSALNFLLPTFILVGFVGLFLLLLFTFTEFSIVLQKKGVLRSMGYSAKLVLLHWMHTLLIGILMLIIGLRIILNVLAIFLVPALIILSGGLLATVTLTPIGIVIGTAVGLAAVIFASYINGILDVFANAVWTYTFLELVDEEKRKDFEMEKKV